MVLIDRYYKAQNYSSDLVVNAFKQAEEVFHALPHGIDRRIKAKQREMLEEMFRLVNKDDAVLVNRTQYLYSTIREFNYRHIYGKEYGEFAENKKNAIQLSNLLGNEFGKGFQLPPLSSEYFPEDLSDLFKVVAFDMGIGRYEVFDNIAQAVEKGLITEESRPACLASCLLVEVYSYAARSSVLEQTGVDLGGDIFVNAICEMVPDGTLKQDMINAGWYDAKWGFDEGFIQETLTSASK